MSETQWMVGRHCASCEFFDHVQDDEGYCRIAPPLRAVGDSENKDWDGHARWPLVWQSDWCGRWTSEDKKETEDE